MWRNWNTHTKLMERENSAAILEKSMVIPQKIKH